MYGRRLIYSLALFSMKKIKPVYEIRVSRINELISDIERINTPEIAYSYWDSIIAKMPWYDPEREQCVAVALNTRSRPIKPEEQGACY